MQKMKPIIIKEYKMNIHKMHNNGKLSNNNKKT